MEGGASGPEGGRVTIQFVDFQDRSTDVFQTLADFQAGLGHEIAGAEITVDKMSEGPPTGAPVNLEIIGEDPQVLKSLADEAIEILEDAPVFPKLVGLETDLDAARPELSVLVDREKAGLYGLSTSSIGMAVRGAINGTEAAKYRTGKDEYDIIVRLAPEWRNALNALADLTVMHEGTQVPLVSGVYATSMSFAKRGATGMPELSRSASSARSASTFTRGISLRSIVAMDCTPGSALRGREPAAGEKGAIETIHRIIIAVVRIAERE